LSFDIRNQLKLNAAAVQIPIGLEGQHTGVIDLVEKKIYFFESLLFIIFFSIKIKKIKEFYNIFN